MSSVAFDDSTFHWLATVVGVPAMNNAHDIPITPSPLLIRPRAVSQAERMTMDGKEYGTWKFKIAANKPAYAGRTERGKADPLTFVEGGKDAFWYERVK